MKFSLAGFTKLLYQSSCVTTFPYMLLPEHFELYLLISFLADLLQVYVPTMLGKTNSVEGHCTVTVFIHCILSALTHSAHEMSSIQFWNCYLSWNMIQ